MNMNALKTDLEALRARALHFNTVTKDLEEIQIPPTTFKYNDTIAVSAEDGKQFADYYGEFRGGYPWISPALEALAKKHGGHWEWINPASIAFYED